jgi:hypothetical protein
VPSLLAAIFVFGQDLFKPFNSIIITLKGNRRPRKQNEYSVQLKNILHQTANEYSCAPQPKNNLIYYQNELHILNAESDGTRLCAYGCW